jgi:ATP-dependent RNA helicase RhlE
VNYELPDEAESYVHRIGRTGRNGADGIAVTLCDPGENAKLRQVERIIRMKLDVTADHLGQPDPKAEPRSNDRAPREAANDRNGNNLPRGDKKPFQGKPGERKPFRGKRRSFGSGKPASRAA